MKTSRAGTSVRKVPFHRQWVALFVRQFSKGCGHADLYNKRTKNGSDMLFYRLERRDKNADILDFNVFFSIEKTLIRRIYNSTYSALNKFSSYLPIAHKLHQYPFLLSVLR